MVNRGTMILRNLKDKVLENEGLDKNEANFCTVMGYKLTENMLTKSCTNEKKRCCKNNSECIKEINDKEISKLVNTYKEVTKSDDDYEIKKYSNKFKRKYDITDIEEMLCPGKCPKKEDVSYTSSYFNKKFRYRKGLKDLLVDEDKKNKHVRMLLEVDRESVVEVKKNSSHQC